MESKRKRRFVSIFQSSDEDSNDSTEIAPRVTKKIKLNNSDDEDLVGAGVTTRRQARLNQDGQAQTADPVPSTSKAQVVEPEEPVEDTQVAESNSIDSGQKGLHISETTLFENDKFSLVIQKQDHQKQKVFRTEDHLYVMRVKIKEGKPPLLRDVITILETAMSEMLTDLKQHFDAKETTLVYITMIQSGMLNALRSGAFDLHQSDNSSILHFVLNMFNRFINSNASLRLNSGFRVYFKTFSYNHVMWSQTRRRTGPVRHRLGQFDTGCVYKNGCVELLPKFQEHFKDLCLPVSVILAFSQYESIKQISTNFSILKHLWLPSDETKSQDAVEKLRSLISDLFMNSLLSSQGPYDTHEAVPILANFFKIQIHILKSSQECQANLISFPPEVNLSLPQIFLYQCREDHVVPIIDLESYFRTNRRFCIFCKKSFSSFYSHACKSKDFFCHLCFGAKTLIEFDELSYLPFKFCYPSKVKENICCKSCNVNFESKHCFQNHLDVCLRKGFFCIKCKRFQKNQQKDSHVCLLSNSRQCFGCKETILENETHICKLQPESLTKNWPKLIFFSFEFEKNNDATCVRCFHLRKKLVNDKKLSWKNITELSNIKCHFHKNSNLSRPVLCYIYEEKSPSKFEATVLTCPFLNISQRDNDSFYFNYDTFNRRPKVSKLFKRRQTNETKSNLTYVADKETKSVLDQFLLFVMNEERKHCTYVSLNENNENMATVLEALGTINLWPKIVKAENRFILIKLECQNSLFLNASNYFSGCYFNLASQFQLSESVHIFPSKWNSAFFPYVGSLPPFEDFQEFLDSKEINDLKQTAYKQLKTDNWHFANELAEHLRSKVRILAFACLSFMKETFEFQHSLILSLRSQEILLLHPFSSNVSTLPSYSYKIFYNFFLNHENIYAAMNEMSFNSVNVSNGEYQLALFLQTKFPENLYQHAFSSSRGQKNFGKYFVDVYSPVVKTVVQFQGCSVHNHIPPHCKHPKRQKLTQDNVVSPYKKSFSTTQSQLKKFESFLKEKFSHQVSQIHYVWECEWKEFQKSQEYQSFVEKSNFPLRRPLNRLIPRIAVRGGLIEIFNLKWTRLNNPDEVFKVVDVNGLYSHIAMTCEFPVDKYVTIIGPDLASVSVKNFQLHYQNVPLVSGQIHCSVLPPSNLNFPFLQFRLNDEFNYLGLCRMCMKKKLQICRHKCVKSKRLTSVWTISEINKALQEGYKLLAVYEVHYFKQTKPLLKHFIQCLSSYRLKYSGELQSDCTDRINSKLELTKEFYLTPEAVCLNNAKKHMFKLMANAFFGKFSQNSNFTTTDIVWSQHRLEEIVSKYEIVHFDNLTESSLLVEYRKNDNKPSLKSNVYIGAEINAQARIFLYDKIKLVQSSGGKVYYCDTDSIFFSLPKTCSDPLLYSNMIGDFKSEVPANCDVISFYSLGCKNYSLLWKDRTTGAIDSIIKVKGLSLTSSHIPNQLNSELYEAYIDSHFKNEFQSIIFPQTRKKCNKKSLLKTDKMSSYQFTNNLFLKRYVNKKTFDTYPYGFVHKLS